MDDLCILADGSGVITDGLLISSDRPTSQARVWALCRTLVEYPILKREPEECAPNNSPFLIALVYLI